MPFVHIMLQSPVDAEAKRELMAFAAGQICRNTSTRPKNVYVYIHEESEENMLKAAPTAVIIWTEMPDRTDGAKKAILSPLTDKLAEVAGGEYRDAIGVLFIDVPLKNAMLGGVSRLDDPDK